MVRAPSPPAVEAERRPLPVDPQVAGVLGVERAFAVAQPADEGAAGFLAEDVAVRQAPLADGLLDHLREPARHAAEKAVAGIEDFARRKPAFARRQRVPARRIAGRPVQRSRIARTAQRAERRCRDRTWRASGAPSRWGEAPLNPLLTRMP